MSYKFTFTVFTPTYNRAYTLDRVYNSLKEQTFRDFEWVIVDDGSSDNTETLVKDWAGEADFPIRYFFQKNSGHHIAFNRGVSEAQGKFFIRIDSDDAFIPDALECFKNTWDEIPDNKKSEFGGLIALCQDHHGNLVPSEFPKNVLDTTLLALIYKYKVTGDKWHLFRTDVLREFPYPPIEKYATQSVIREAIAQKYKVRLISKPLRIYYLFEDGRNDHLTGSSPFKHTLGFAVHHQFVLNSNINWFRYAPLDFFRSGVHYSRFSFLLGRSIAQQQRELNNPLGKFLWATMLPLGFLVSLKDKLIYKKKN